MTNEELPAISWLGYGLNMTGTTPMDISAAANAVIHARRIISYDLDTGLRQVVIDGVTYDVPSAIGISMDDNGNSGSYLTFSSGNDASIAFSNDSSLALRYYAITGDSSVGAAIEKTFRRTNQYAFYNFNQNRYLASLRDYVDLLNVQPLLTGINDLPTPFNGQNAFTVKAYRQFFENYGTHVVIRVRYGARMQLNVWAANSDANVNRVWSGNVNTEHGGIPSGGSFDSSLQTQPQYKMFQEFMQRLITVTGGDTRLATSITIDPSKYGVYEDWTKTVSTRTSLLGLDVTNLWSLMRMSTNSMLRAAAPDIQKAYEHITTTPQVYRTNVTLDVQSDWAEFGLLTPSAVVVKTSTLPDLTQLSETKVTWGRERSHNYRRETINFAVVNDGYPIDFYISHGSNGSQPGSGNARVTIEGQTYVNDRITDNNWNTVWFYQARVTGTATKFTMGRSPYDPRHAWDDLLERYLREVEGKPECGPEP